MSSLEYVRQAAEVAGFTPAIKKLGGAGQSGPDCQLPSSWCSKDSI